MELKIKILFLVSILILNTRALALECEWWQVKVKTHIVDPHKREGVNISSHQRKEHCREKWNFANLYISRLVDSLPEGWQSLKENYRPWKKSEKEIILKLLAGIPDSFRMDSFYFYRAQKSEYKNNPASIHLNSRSITLYDIFFDFNPKSEILVHEAGHYHFSELSEAKRDPFLILSGWEKVIKDGTLQLLPPKALIKADSNISPEEDFSNYVETYYESPKRLKNKNLKLFQYFEERYSR